MMTITMNSENDRFEDVVGQHILDGIQVEIEENLFEDWNNANLDEGWQYAEWQFFSYADRNTKDKFNEHYGYISTDEYYL